MKKAIAVLFFVVAACCTFAQAPLYETTLNGVSVIDTTLFPKMPVGDDYIWGRQVAWEDNTDTIQIIMMHSLAKRHSAPTAPADKLFCPYNLVGDDTIVRTSAEGTVIIEDPLGLTGTWHGTKIIVTDSAKIWLWTNYRKK